MKIKLFLLLLLLSACGTSKTVSVLAPATPLPPDAPVEIIGIGQKVPDGAKLLGNVKIGDGGFSTKCSYDVVVADAQKQARSMGGNLLQITKHKEPDLGSTCHRIQCVVYLIK